MPADDTRDSPTPRLNDHCRCELSMLSFEYMRPGPCFESVAARLYQEDPFAGVMDPDLAHARDRCVITYTPAGDAASKELTMDSFLCHLVSEAQLRGTAHPRPRVRVSGPARHTSTSAATLRSACPAQLRSWGKSRSTPSWSKFSRTARGQVPIFTLAWSDHGVLTLAKP